jgi:hypothetical protein
MSDPSGIPSVLGIETVEWFAEGGENLTVRVTGRWRRRRPAWSVQPILVVEAAGRRFRFPAMPEPPSLTGTGPGMWRISFAVPAALAPELGGRTWLQFGAVVVPLPSADRPVTDISSDEPAPEPPPGSGEPPPESIAAARGIAPPAPRPEAATPSPPSSEVEAEEARRRALDAEDRADELAARVRDLEHELAEARLEAQRLSASLGERELSRRVAEQRAHAEQALRRDLARQLVGSDREGEKARSQLAATEQRIHELEHELGDARRRGDEAEQAAAAATAARQRAERQIANGGAPPASRDEGERLSLEQRLVARHAGSEARVPAEPPAVPAASPEPPPAPPPPSPPPAPPPSPAWSVTEPVDIDPVVSALRLELRARAAAEAALRGRLVDAESTLAARVLIERRTAETLAQLRGELDGLRAAFAGEQAARAEAERRAASLAEELSGRRERSREAYDAIAELRQALEPLLREPEPGAAPGPASGAAGAAGPPVAGVVEPERFNDARMRLRQAVAPQPPGPEGPDSAPGQPVVAVPDDERTPIAWLEPIWSELARTDPGTAGRLLVELLPAQHEASADAVAYDLVFGGGRGCAQVTVRHGATVIRHADGPRQPSDVDFQVTGDPGAIARLLTTGPFRRRFGRGVARVRGRKGRLVALRSLVGVRLDLRGLHRIGVRFEPELALRLVALMIDPAWTERERFAVGYAGAASGAAGGAEVYLQVRDGGLVEVTTDAPAGRIATTITGPADAAALVLSGERTDEVVLSGEEWPLALLRKWIKRAQSG